MLNLILPTFFQFIIGLTTICVIIILWLYYRLTFFKRQGIPQSILHFKNVASMPMQLADQKLVKKMGKLVGIYEIIFPTIIVADPELVTEILIKNFRTFSDHRMWTPEGAPFHHSMFQQSYHQWKPTRAVLSPLFTSGNLKKMQHLIEAATSNLIKHLDKRLANGSQVIDMRNLIEGNVMDMVTRCIFGTVIDSVDDPNHPLVAHARLFFGTDESFGQMLAKSLPSLMWKFGITSLDIRALEYLTGLSKEIIKNRTTDQKTYHQDLLQLTIDTDVIKSNGQKQKLTPTEIVDNCISYFTASYDTTSTTLNIALYILAKHPKVQKLVVDEINEKLDGNVIDYDKMNQLKYLDAFLNESQRWMPSVARSERKVTEDCHLGPAFLPKGTLVVMPLYFIHRDPDNFEDPDEFKIERFFPENRHNIRPGTFIPFADGPRNCIGMRFALLMVKVCLVMLLRKYKIVATDKTNYVPHFGRLVNMPKEMIVQMETRAS